MAEKEKLSRRISIDRFDNLGLNKAMDTSDILDLNNDELSRELSSVSIDIIKESTNQLSIIENEMEESKTSDLKYIKDNKFKNEYIINETINKLFNESVNTGDPKFYLLLKQFVELSIKNDESLMKIVDKMNGGVKGSNITGNENVNIQNNYYDDKPSIAVGSPAELLQAYGESYDHKKENKEET